ncbi:MAG: flavin reductase family protein [Candidatus Eisenbacteria bacterium]|nr:flavin reductase family protein [Candidatus Eisenbacteria bacterium]
MKALPKRALDSGKLARLVNHGPTVLVTSAHTGRDNIITLAWCMPVSIRPPMVGVAIAPARFSHDLIRDSGEFTVNVPHAGLLDAVWRCGTVSGRDGDKFAASGLTRCEPSVIGAPLIDECIAHIECRVDSAPVAGDHTVFMGTAVAASVEDGAFDGRLTLRDRHHTLHHLGGSEFLTSAGEIISAA